MNVFSKYVIIIHLCVIVFFLLHVKNDDMILFIIFGGNSGCYLSKTIYMYVGKFLIVIKPHMF